MRGWCSKSFLPPMNPRAPAAKSSSRSRRQPSGPLPCGGRGHDHVIQFPENSMDTKPSRPHASSCIQGRDFLPTGAAAMGLAWLPENVLAEPRRAGPNEKLNLAFIGVGG